MHRIIGIDEVGRGPLAGPVAVCAFSIAADFDMNLLAGIRDSKKLSPKRREDWFARLSDLKKKGLVDFFYVETSSADIDRIGIAPAIKQALAACLDGLDAIQPLDPARTEIFLDGSLVAPKKFVLQQTIIRGDDTVKVISAASVVAKVLRDAKMDTFAKKYPNYGFDSHKGYGTAAHIKMLKKHGPSPIHRRSFISHILE